MSAETPSTELPGLRPLTIKELVQRQHASACLADSVDRPMCSKFIWTSIFFDGTNNNLVRDIKDNSQSNIVVLLNTHKTPDQGDYYPIYIPGVGTHFEAIGETHESQGGKAKASGGEARIHYAMIQLYNSVHQAVFGIDKLLVGKAEVFDAVQSYWTLNNVWTLSGLKRRWYFKKLGERLTTAIKDQKPEIKLINLSVFGFSRGAAQARTYCNWLLECCDRLGGGYGLCGIPIRFNFLGIFDTVASVGLADASPIGDGLMDWADGTMRIPDAVERTVHFVAAHEIRQNFPLSTGRDGTSYPSNCIEVVYPGAHSDVGGGYAAGEQGKAVAGRAHMLSQIPLVHMYQEAMKSGVPLMTIKELDELEDDDTFDNLQISPILKKRFQAYAEWSKLKPQKVESMLLEHMRLYWRWRLITLDFFYDRQSYKAANEQDKIDMEASEHDFRESLKAVDNANMYAKHPIPMVISDGIEWLFVEGLKAIPANRLIMFFQTANDEKIDPTAVTAVLQERDNVITSQIIFDFFDQHVHDSHASFRLLGPTTKEERQEVIAKVKEKYAKWESTRGSRGAKFEKLNPLEERIMEQVRAAEKLKADPADSFPVMGENDINDLRDMTDLLSSLAVRLITSGRRESGSILRRRRVLAKS